MPTHTTVLSVEDQIVTLLDAALTVPVTYAWPGPDTAPECVFLGLHPAVADIVLDLSSEDPVIKAGRRQSQEEYELTLTIWAFRPDVSAADARVASGAAHEIYDAIYDVFVNDARIGLGNMIQRTEVRGFDRRQFPFMSGWACEMRVRIYVSARLT